MLFQPAVPEKNPIHALLATVFFIGLFHLSYAQKSHVVNLHKIACSVETDEVGDDEPYLLVTAVDLKSIPPNLDVFLYGVWEDFASGDVRENKQKPFWGLDSKPKFIYKPDDVIFLATLMENDDGSPAAKRSTIKGIAAAAVAGSLGMPRHTIVQKLITDIEGAARIPSGAPNFDDYVNTLEVRLDARDLIKPKNYFTLGFHGDGGSYNLTFEVRHAKEDNIAVRRGSEIIMDLNFNASAEQRFNFGHASDEFLVGDWDGDGKDNIAVRRGSEIIMDLNFDAIADKRFKFGNGNSEDEYLVGDWNGDGKDNIAVRRGNEIIMDYNFDSKAEKRFRFGDGNNEDEYLVGDWNKDGWDNIAVRKGSEIRMDFNFNSDSDKKFSFGQGNNEDEYLVGDWNGDGKDNIAVRRNSEIVMDFNFDSHADKRFHFGNGNGEQQYLVGDWDGK